MVKYGPPSIYKEISDILNLVAEKGDTPEELSQGIITPLQKTRKEKRTNIQSPTNNPSINHP